jgi:PAS domain S-box-containing protein
MILKSSSSGRSELQRRIDSSVHSISLCDLRREDAPLVYVNSGFENLTGYTPQEVIGHNCRLLQGPDTDPQAVQKIRDAISAGAPLVLDLLNYRKDGRPFWNRLSLRPVRQDGGPVTHFIGIQSDISALKDLEERLHDYALELGS